MEYNIVIPNNASMLICFVANELVNFINKVTGEKPVIIYEKQSIINVNIRYFYLGNTLSAQIHNIILNEEDINYYGFVIKKIDNIVFIVGARDRGTAYGVYDYIENNLGVRFIAEDETFIPQNVTDIFNVQDKIDIPDIQLRSYLNADVVHSQLHSLRKRFSTLDGEREADFGYSLDYDFVDECHNTLKLVKPCVWQSTHPEFFAIKDGIVSDICWTNGLDDNGNLTDENLSVAKILITSLKEKILRHPTARFFEVGQTDTLGDYCHCDNCNKIREKYGQPSALIIRMLNAVIKELSSWAKTINREVNIVTFAYSYSEKPPIKFDKNNNPYVVDNSVICHPNLYIRLAPMSHNIVFPINSTHQEELHNSIEGWKLICKQFFIWEYDTNFCEYLMYYPSLMHIKDNCMFYKQIGVKYIMMQGQYNTDINFTDKIKSYVASKVLWDNQANVQNLKNEYIDLYYKQSSGVVKQIIGLLDDNITKQMQLHSEFGLHMYLHNYGAELDYKYYPLQMLENIIDLIDNELIKLESVKNEILIRRIKFIKLVPLRMIMINYNNYFPTKTINQQREFVRNFCNLCDSLGVTKLCEGEGGVIPENNLEYGPTVAKLKEKFQI